MRSHRRDAKSIEDLILPMVGGLMIRQKYFSDVGHTFYWKSMISVKYQITVNGYLKSYMLASKY